MNAWKLKFCFIGWYRFEKLKRKIKKEKSHKGCFNLLDPFQKRKTKEKEDEWNLLWSQEEIKIKKRDAKVVKVMKQNDKETQQYFCFQKN